MEIGEFVFAKSTIHPSWLGITFHHIEWAHININEKLFVIHF